MKRILKVLILFVAIFSCSVGPKYIRLNNADINNYATRKINTSKNYIIAQAKLTNLNTRASNGYIYSDLSYSYKILGGAISESKGIVKTKYKLEVSQNKLYLKEPEILSIRDINGLIPDKKIKDILANLVINSLTYVELHDFKDTAYVKDVHIGSNSVILIME